MPASTVSSPPHPSAAQQRVCRPVQTSVERSEKRCNGAWSLVGSDHGALLLGALDADLGRLVRPALAPILPLGEPSCGPRSSGPRRAVSVASVSLQFDTNRHATDRSIVAPFSADAMGSEVKRCSPFYAVPSRLFSGQAGLQRTFRSVGSGCVVGRDAALALFGACKHEDLCALVFLLAGKVDDLGQL